MVLDNLNPHKPASRSETFPPAEAHRRRQQLEFHSPPQQGSWLNMAEIDLSVFARPCLPRRSATEATLKRELAAVEAARNAPQATFTGSSRRRRHG